MKKKIVLSIALLFVSSILLTACTSKENRIITQTREIPTKQIEKENKEDKEISILKIKTNKGEQTCELKENNTFTVNGSGMETTFTIMEIGEDKIKLEADDIGYVEPNEDGTISLLKKQKKFTFDKDETLVLEAQIMDASFTIEITVE